MDKHFSLKLSLVALVAISLAVFSFATTPAPSPEIQGAARKNLPQLSTRQRQSTPPTDDRKREQTALLLMIRCTLEREVAKERYAELTEVSDIDSIDTKAAVEAWKAWSEVETRCANVGKMPRLAERDGAPNNPN